MTVKEIIEKLDLKLITGESLLEREVKGGYVGDLLSVVMGKAMEDNVWVTVQSHINIIAVAALVDVSCIIVSEGFNIDEDATAKAREEDIILLSSKASSFEICSRLGQLGV